MCGIGGILALDPGKTVDDARLREMQRVLRHRGPDDGATWTSAGIGLTHRRLAIIDPTRARQPFGDAKEEIWLAYNGEVYNHQELRATLRATGCQFSTHSDTETILQLYRELGPSCIGLLRGMFALAIWDGRHQRLLLARDRLGIKPLYYTLNDTELVFASEIKGIFAGGALAPELDRDVLPEYLAWGFVGGARTFFRGVRELAPGTLLIGSPRTGFEERVYWRLPARVWADDGSTVTERGEEVRAALEAAVDSHLMSDVPLGVFLSGGLDSSALAALAARRVREPLRTFAVGFDDPSINELPYARAVAQHIGAQHREVVLSPEAFADALPQLIWHADEPMAFSASVPLYFVSSLAAQSVKVVLSGEGADEIFLGYNRHRVTAANVRVAALLGQLPGVVHKATRALGRSLPGRAGRYAVRSAFVHDPGLRALYCDNFSVFPSAWRARLLPRAAHVHDPHAHALGCISPDEGDVLHAISALDIQTYLVALLAKQDRMSMAASVESRVPYLDHALVEEVLSMPSRFKIDRWQSKAVLRAAVSDLVPPWVLRRPKMGFSMPLARWLREDCRSIVDNWVLSPRALDRGLIDRHTVRQLAVEHSQGVDHSQRLWLLTNLELWMRAFIDGDSPAQIREARTETTNVGGNNASAAA